MNLRQAIALRPDHRHAHNNLGLVLARSGRPEAALEEFRRAGCTEADAHNNLAFALTLEGHWPEARSHYERALSLAPSLTPAQEGLRQLDLVMAKTDPSAGDGGKRRPGPEPERASLPVIKAPDAAVKTGDREAYPRLVGDAKPAVFLDMAEPADTNAGDLLQVTARQPEGALTPAAAASGVTRPSSQQSSMPRPK
jgi:tetratricopeptide (TPR) repeat protein